MKALFVPLLSQGCCDGYYGNDDNALDMMIQLCGGLYKRLPMPKKRAASLIENNNIKKIIFDQ